MAIKKKGGDSFSADESVNTTDVTEETAARKNTTSGSARKPLTIAAIVGGGVLALGAAFGIGLATAQASPLLHGGPEFAAGAGPIAGHGDRDGDGPRDGGRHGGPGKLQHQGEARVGGPGMDAETGDFCHPGDGHTHDAQGNDVAPSDAAEGFTCQTGPAGGPNSMVPAPTTAP